MSGRDALEASKSRGGGGTCSAKGWENGWQEQHCTDLYCTAWGGAAIDHLCSSIIETVCAS